MKDGPCSKATIFITRGVAILTGPSLRHSIGRVVWLLWRERNWKGVQRCSWRLFWRNLQRTRQRQRLMVEKDQEQRIVGDELISDIRWILKLDHPHTVCHFVCLFGWTFFTQPKGSAERKSQLIVAATIRNCILLLLSVSMNVSLYNTDLAMGKCSPAHIVLCNESTLQAQIPYLLWGQIDCWGGLRFPAVVNFRWPCSWTLLRFFFVD